jgi:D-alanyl-D-alanine carboxypeptidase (penicillin-binding protein 5/6)
MDFLRFSRVVVLGALLAGTAQARESFLIVEAHSGRIVGRQGEDERRPVASLTKIATAMVVLDWAELTKRELTQEAVVPSSAALLGGSNPMGLQPGDRLTLRNALYSALLGSDNVAAQTLAHHVGWSIQEIRGESGDPVRTFVREMNHLAGGLGMTRTRFDNPHGMDNARERGVSTATDMARLCIYATRNPAFSFYVKQPSRRISFIRGQNEYSFTVSNTNKLLGELDINGIKTGTTVLAGECLAVSSERSNLVRKMDNGRTQLIPRRLIAVVLGSPDRFTQTRALVAQGWANWERWQAAGRPVVDGREELLQVPNPR